MPNAVIAPSHFASRDTVRLARDLLGTYLVVAQPDGQSTALMVTETEAYIGPEDLACHASKGRTRRTEVLYGPPGHWYIYLIYGIHEMLNVVTGPEDHASAILIRALEGLSGPGRLTKRLAIDRRLNAQPALPATGLHLEDRGIRIPDSKVLITPRIGVDYAGPDWANRPYRFVVNS